MIRIDRLASRMAQGKELGLRVAERLPAGMGRNGGTIGRLRIRVAARPHESTDELAGRIADEIARRLKRSV